MSNESFWWWFASAIAVALLLVVVLAARLLLRLGELRRMLAAVQRDSSEFAGAAASVQQSVTDWRAGRGVGSDRAQPSKENHYGQSRSA